VLEKFTSQITVLFLSKKIINYSPQFCILDSLLDILSMFFELWMRAYLNQFGKRVNWFTFTVAILNLGLGEVIARASGALQTANNLSEIKAMGAAALSAAQSNLGLGSSASRNIGDKANQIPDMSSFIYQNIGGVLVSRLPSGLTIQAGKNATDSAGVKNINLPVAIVDGIAFACEIGVSAWSISEGIYSFITTYGVEITSNSTILVRDAIWRGSDKNFIPGSTSFSWFVVGKS